LTIFVRSLLISFFRGGSYLKGRQYGIQLMGEFVFVFV